MSDHINKHVLVIGAGAMAIEHVKVLKDLGTTIEVVGRGGSSASEFEVQTGIRPILGGIKHYLEKNPTREDDYIIIAVGTEMLMPTLLLFVNQKFKRILIEKPAAISIEELIESKNLIKEISDRVYIAYNRRFYSSVIELMRQISISGGLKTMFFEFTEWSHKIEPLEKAPGVKDNWFFANSSHVVDLAFYIGGAPNEMACYSKSGKIGWHKKSNYAGAGITEKGVLFSYMANWESPGRWALEFLADDFRYFLKPLEKLYMQRKGSLQVEEIKIEDDLDIQYKPGIYRMLNSFLAENIYILDDIRTHLENSITIYSKMIE